LYFQRLPITHVGDGLLAPALQAKSSSVPFKTGRGSFAKYGQSPSAEEIDANRADMFRNFGESF
jgi:hypothetical protein